MFERFTDRARRVVVFAQEEARLLDHNSIGTEHLLLGLVHEGDGVAARALDLCDVSLEAVRAQVLSIVRSGLTTPSGHIPFTDRAKAVLELSLREALQLGHNYIGTEHILLGLLREGDGVAARVLTDLGVELDHVRTVVVGLLTGDNPEEGPAPGRRLMTERARARAMEAPAVVSRGPRPAACSFCGVPSPASGQLFAGTEGALICRRCAESIVAQPTAQPYAWTLPLGASRPTRFGPPPMVANLEELVASVVPTGPPPADETAARAEIEHAALHMNALTADRLGFEHVHDADDLVPYSVEAQRRFGSFASRADQMVDAVVFVHASEAVFWRSATLDGRPIPQLHRREGRASLIGGRWLVTRATMLDSLSISGMFIPPRDDEPPVV